MLDNVKTFDDSLLAYRVGLVVQVWKIRREPRRRRRRRIYKLINHPPPPPTWPGRCLS